MAWTRISALSTFAHVLTVESFKHMVATEKRLDTLLASATC